MINKFKIIKFVNFNKLDLGLKKVYKLAKLIATIPSITALVERTFLAIKIMKLYSMFTHGQ